MKVSELGEFGLIQRIAQKVASAAALQPQVWHGVKVGIGDDAAAWQFASGGLELATTDTLVQDVHFSLETATWEELGWKALAVNISDVAAMGGVSRYALVTLALPGDLLVEAIDRLYDGLLEAAGAYGVAIVGGDIVTAPCIVITVALWGSLEGEKLLTRSAAQPGDQIAVTGFMGDSAGGLAMMQAKMRPGKEVEAYLRRVHYRPRPRAAEGPLLARLGVKAAIDISDGLVADLGHVCQASGVVAQVYTDKIPLSSQLREAFGDRALSLALFGGEDYELLFTAPRDVVAAVQREIPCPMTVIGVIVPGELGKVTLLDDEGNALPWERGGWEHFVSSG